MKKIVSLLSKKNLVFVLIFLVVIVSFVATKGANTDSGNNEQTTPPQNNPLKRGEVINKNFIHEIPMRMVQDLIFVDVKINGKTYNFMYDTGAFTVFSKKLVEELQLKKIPVPGTTKDSSGNVNSTEIYHAPLMEFGGVEFANYSVAGIDIDHLIFECAKIDGLLGINVMASLYTQLNYQDKKILISDSPFDETGYTRIEFRIGPRGGMYLPIQFEFGGNWFHLDTGYRGYISIGDLGVIPEMEKHQYPLRKKKGIIGANINTVVESETSHYIAKNLLIGSIEIDSAPVEVIEQGTLLLGNKLLQKFNIVFNIPQQTVAFKKAFGDKIAISFPDTLANTFGLSLFWNPEKKLFVSTIEEKALADQEGIVMGDRVIAINGKDTSDLAKNDFCSLFLNYENHYDNKKRLDLTVIGKNGKQKNYSLIKQKR